MSLPIKTQTFLVEVSASVMPPMTADELHNAVSRLAYEKESRRGMGFLDVQVRAVHVYDEEEEYA